MLYTSNLNLGKPEASDTVNPNSRNAWNTNMDTLDALGCNYVLAEGTTTTTQSTEAGGGSQTWYYRKWSNGKLEAWTEYYYSGVACDTATGSVYATSAIQESYPSMFTSTTCINISKSAGAIGWLVVGTGRNATTFLLPQTYIYRSVTSSSMNFYVSYHVIGTWQ